MIYARCVEPETRGHPQSPLLWTSKSRRKLGQSLRDMGHTIGRTLVGEFLHGPDCRLQANRKTREGSHNPDRDVQFHYINDPVKEALAAGESAISVDTKKELVGDFKNARREWRPKGSPRKFACTISSSPNSGAPHPMVSTISPTTSDGSVWASTTIPRLLRPTLFEAGGISWGASAISAPPAS
jgi:hypothetical protein